MEKLKGKTIYVGRESGTNRLLVYGKIDGKLKGLPVGDSGIVPASVSRAVPEQGKAHLSLKIDQEGKISVTNLKDTNITMVNGTQVVSKKINHTDNIELGVERFSLPLNIVLGSFKKLIGNPHSGPEPGGSAQKTETKTFNISHLERVWNKFNDKNIEVAEKQRKINLTRTGLGIFTMCAVPTIFFLGPIGYVLTGIGVLGNLYGFWGMKNSETSVERQKRQDEFDDNWICPNPECGRSLQAKNYKMLERNYKSCPHCKSKYVTR